MAKREGDRKKAKGGSSPKKKFPTRRDASCGVIPVHLRDGTRHYLLIQHHAGHWGFPKGHPEKGETELEAARRELLEETGIAAVELLPEPRMSESYTFRGYLKGGGRGGLVQKTVTYFIGLVEDPTVTPQAEEISDYAWGTYEQTMKMLGFKEARRILEESERALASR